MLPRHCGITQQDSLFHIRAEASSSFLMIVGAPNPMSTLPQPIPASPSRTCPSWSYTSGRAERCAADPASGLGAEGGSIPGSTMQRHLWSTEGSHAGRRCPAGDSSSLLHPVECGRMADSVGEQTRMRYLSRVEGTLAWRKRLMILISSSDSGTGDASPMSSSRRTRGSELLVVSDPDGRRAHCLALRVVLIPPLPSCFPFRRACQP